MDGTIEIVEDEIQSGGILHIDLQSPPDKKFIAQIRIFKDPPQENIDANSFPLAIMTGQVPISAEQDAVPPGAPFSVIADTLNYLPGVYYFTIFAGGTATVHDHVTIMPASDIPHAAARADMTGSNRLFALYNQDGLFLTGHDDDGPEPGLTPGEVYILGLRLGQFNRFNNTIHVNFFDPGGAVLEKPNILRIKAVRGQPFDQVLTQGACPGEELDVEPFQDGVATILFRTPQHQKYYEYDGQLQFHLAAKTDGGPDCELADLSFSAQFNDPPASPTLPDFATHNAATYPGQPWRNNFPFDTRHVRIVRFGSVGMTTDAELTAAAVQVTEHFELATKQYFRLVVDGHHHFPLSNAMNQEKVINWYQNAPKTPGKPTLDLASPNELYLATLLYYIEHQETEFVNDMKALYPPLSNGEERTVYLFDGPGSLGQAMGQDGHRVKVTRLYPGYVFYQGTGAERTYHFDLEACGFCGDTTEEYLEYLQSDGTDNQIYNTTIHEFGHNYWIKEACVSAGDQQTRKLPFNSDLVYEDDSLGYFTRFEYMSYGRNRNVLLGMSYGDALLERVLQAYARPEVAVEFISHPDIGDQTITVAPGEDINFHLTGEAGSGLRMLWYYNESGPVPLPYGDPKKFIVKVFPTDNPCQNIDIMNVTFTLFGPGVYVYRYRARSRLYPINWQPHQSLLGTFTIQVQA